MLAIGVHERYKPNFSGVCYVETKSLDGEYRAHNTGSDVFVRGRGGSFEEWRHRERRSATCGGMKPATVYTTAGGGEFGGTRQGYQVDHSNGEAMALLLVMCNHPPQILIFPESFEAPMTMQLVTCLENELVVMSFSSRTKHLPPSPQLLHSSAWLSPMYQML